MPSPAGKFASWGCGIWLASTLAASCAAPRLPELATEPSFALGEKTQIDNIVRKEMEDSSLPGVAIGIVRDGEPFYARGYGRASFEPERPVHATTTFHTASISKVFTALAVMTLRDQGKLSLDQRVEELLPELRYGNQRAKEITLRQLLNHTSGLPDVSGYDWASANRSSTALSDYFQERALKAKFEPGSLYRYSNLGYDLLGLVVARASGESFENYVEQEVLRPAGMESSGYRYYELDAQQSALPHTKTLFGRVVARSVYPYNREHAPSSTLNASAEDLSRWMADFMGRWPGNASLEEMMQPSTSVTDSIGLGFQRYDLGGTPAAGHFGGDQGFRSYLFLVPDEELGIVVMSNCDYEEDFRQRMVGSLLRLLRR